MTLAYLPWLRQGIMPDWLRSALLRELPAHSRVLIHAKLKFLLDSSNIFGEYDSYLDLGKLAIYKNNSIGSNLKNEVNVLGVPRGKMDALLTTLISGSELRSRIEGGERQQVPVLGVLVDVLDWSTAVERICEWAERRESRYVSICDAHSIVRASRDAVHGRHIRGADMVTPDGWPVAWMLRRFGHPRQERINGPDLMERLLVEAELRGLSIFVYGMTGRTLQALESELLRRWPRLKIVGLFSPPFRPLSPEEDAAHVERINASGAHLIMTGLGCPKEDRWMHEHRGRVQGVMLGIGAGIDFHAGTVARAPVWMRDHGLEWLFRLSQEPRRLWRRYLVNNTLFVLGAARQVARLTLAQMRRSRQQDSEPPK